ncbi:MAG: hypothetical protein A2X36_02720 [Elusimicrobia bacterium GWA2_69_24]|nr:MAG: hypothetical protein A2X36_02720 [Elusimicrobia bacterium GWA2_69_24]HBL19053.1 hypothetical protein [Elusimicrobiota bacterium]
MTFRAKLFLAVLAFSILPLAYSFGMAEYMTGPVLIAVFCVCWFTLLGALAGAVKVDQIVRAAQERALRSEVELRNFLERVHDGVFRVDAEGRILEINPAMAQALQYEPDFLKGRNLWEYLQTGKGAPGPSWLQAGRNRGTFSMTGRLKSGGTVELIADLHALQEDGVFRGFRGCARPAEALLKTERLKQRVAQDLFAGLGQGLRAFLHEVEGIPAQPADLDSARAALAGAIARLGRRLAVFATENALTDWTPVLRRRPVDPQQLQARVCARFQPAMEARAQTLVRSSFGEGGGLVGDPDQLMELLGNLLGNAVKYSPDGGEIVFTYRETESGHGFAVSDNGIGLSLEDLSRACSPFFRAENAVNSRVPGFGLGLWKARRIAEAHGGRLTAESEPGKGATFTLVLPKSVDPDA